MTFNRKRDRSDDETLLSTYQSLAGEGGLSDEWVEVLAQTMESNSLSDELKSYVDAAKYDINNAISTAADAEAFTANLITEMLSKNVHAGIIHLLTETGSCVLEIAPDHPGFHLALLQVLCDGYLALNENQHAKLKSRKVIVETADANTTSLLNELGCNADTILQIKNHLIKIAGDNPAAYLPRMNALRSAFNRIIIDALNDPAAKAFFICCLLEVDHDLTKRQRLNLVPVEYQKAVYTKIKTRLSTVEMYLFDLEGLEDEKSVLRYIRRIKRDILEGEIAGDCCKAVSTEFRLSVLKLFLDEQCSATFIIAALGDLPEDLVQAYLRHITPKWMTAKHVSYYRLIEITAVYSDIERILIDNIQYMQQEHAVNILSKLQCSLNNHFMQYALYRLPAETVCDFISTDQTILRTNSQITLKEVFRIILLKYKVAVADEDLTNIKWLARYHDYNLWSALQDNDSIDSFHRAVNAYVAQLPPNLIVAVLHVIMEPINEADYAKEFLSSQSYKQLYLEERIHIIADDFVLCDLMDLCAEALHSGVIINNFSSTLLYNDITMLRSLVETNAVTQNEVKQCVLRCYENYTCRNTNFVINTEMSVFLILLHQFSIKKFDNIVKTHFAELAESGFVKALQQFPAETRARVLSKTTVPCPIRELSKLSRLEIISDDSKTDIPDYLIRVLQLAVNRSSYTYLLYLKNIYSLNQDSFLAYCQSLKSLRNITASQLVKLGEDIDARTVIAKAIGKLIPEKEYNNLVRDKVIQGKKSNSARNDGAKFTLFKPNKSDSKTTVTLVKRKTK